MLTIEQQEKFDAMKYTNEDILDDVNKIRNDIADRAHTAEEISEADRVIRIMNNQDLL